MIALPSQLRWRPHQQDAATRVAAALASAAPHWLALQLPCGSGKSIAAIAGALASGRKTCLVAHTRAHVAQLSATAERHWPGQTATLYGHSYYCDAAVPCRRCGVLPASRSDAVCAECGHEYLDEACGPDCPYRQALARAVDAPLAVLTLQGYLLRRRLAQRACECRACRGGDPCLPARGMRLGLRPVIVDEAHLLRQVLRGHLSQRATWPELRDQPGLQSAISVALQGRTWASLHQRSQSKDRLGAAAAQQLGDTLRAVRCALHAKPTKDLCCRRSTLRAERCLHLLRGGSDELVTISASGVQVTPIALDPNAHLPGSAVLMTATMPDSIQVRVPDGVPLERLIADYPSALPAPKLQWWSSPAKKDRSYPSTVAAAVDALAADGSGRRVMCVAMSKRDAKAVAAASRLPTARKLVKDDGLNLSQLLARAEADRRAVIFGDCSLMTGVDLPGGMHLVLYAAPLLSPSPELEAERLAHVCASTIWECPQVRDDQLTLLRQAIGRAVRCETDDSIVHLFARGDWTRLQPGCGEPECLAELERL